MLLWGLSLKLVPTAAMSDVRLWKTEYGECLGPKTGVTHYVQPGLPGKGRAIKDLVVCDLTSYPGCLNRKGEIWLPLVIFRWWTWRHGLQSHTYEVIDRYGWSKMINSSSKMPGFFKHEPLVAASAAASIGKNRDSDCGL